MLICRSQEALVGDASTRLKREVSQAILPLYVDLCASVKVRCHSLIRVGAWLANWACGWVCAAGFVASWYAVCCAVGFRMEADAWTDLVSFWQYP